MYKYQVYKDIDRDNYNVTPFKTYKEWSLDSSSYSDYDIYILNGITSSKSTVLEDEPTNPDGTYKYGVHSIVNNLHYKQQNKPYYNFDDYNEHVTKSISGSITWISVPVRIYGEQIKPESVRLDYGSTPSYTIYDDGNQNLYDSSNNNHVGNVFYKTGDVILTNTDYVSDEVSSSLDLLEFRSTWTIYEHEVICEINKGEFNSTTNKSIYSGYVTQSEIVSGSGYIKDNLTGSEWDPYMTTIGLYNDNYELLAMGKFAKPIKNDKDLDMIISITFDT